MRRLLIIGIVGVIVGVAWFRVLSGRKVRDEEERLSPPRVAVVRVKERVFTEILEVPGVTEPERRVIVSAEAPGRVREVLVEEGEKVREGQILVLMDEAVQKAAVEAARAELEAARSRLTQAVANYRSLSRRVEAEVRGARAAVKEALSRLKQAEEAARMEEGRVSAAERSAREALRAAEARLRLLKRGAREEEVRAAEARLRAVEAALRDAERMEVRMRRLYEEGAVPRRAWEEASTKVEALRAEVEAARAQLEMLRKGAREEEVRAAEAEVRRAEAALEAAVAGKGSASIAVEEVEAARAQLERARAKLALALSREADLEAAREEVALWEARVKGARAQLDRALEELRKARIRAPITGVITERRVEPGQVVSPGFPLLSIGVVSRVAVKCFVAEEDLGRIEVGAKAKVRFDALPGREFLGRVREVSPVADPKTGKFFVKVLVSNEGGLLKPGMTAEVRIYISAPRRSPAVPERAVGRERGVDFVWVVEGGVVRRRAVALGVKEGRWVEVLSGLRAGELVAVRGVEGLEEGQRVEVVVREGW